MTKEAGNARCLEQVMLAVRSLEIGHTNRHSNSGLVWGGGRTHRLISGDVL